jgi:undecaprenyl-diphosphatase
MNWWQAIVLGIIEGLTEYLPISSTGHLLVAQRLLGIEKSQASDAFAICIQAGAIIAVLGLYSSEVRRIVSDLLGSLGIGPGSNGGLRLLRNLVVAFLPAAVIGKLFDEQIEEKLLRLIPVSIAWLAGGLVILLYSWRRSARHDKAPGRTMLELTWQGALAIGFMQCLAMLPGTSRSLVTILGGLFVGLGLSAAVEFSFLLGVLTLLAATAYKSLDSGKVMLEAYSWPILLLSTFSAWLSAVVAVKWMINYLRRRDMSLFGYYRMAIGVIVLILVYFDVIRD